MMANLLLNAGVLLLVQYTLAQTTDDRQSDASEYTARDPTTAFLDELGLLILDVDEAFSRQTAPKVEFEDRMKEQMYGRPRSEYFNRIRENYRKIQRIGSTPIGDLSVSSNLFGVNVKNKGRASAVDVSIPSLPIQWQVRSEIPTVEEYDSKASGNKEASRPKSRFASKFNFGDTNIKIDSTFAFPEISLKTREVPESGSKDLDHVDGRGVKAPESRFSSSIKVGDSRLNMDSAFTLPDVSIDKPKGMIHESGSKSSDKTEITARKSRVPNKIKTQNSAFNFDWDFTEAEQAGGVQESSSQLTDSAERSDIKSQESLFANTIAAEDSEMNMDSVFALPEIQSEHEQIEWVGESDFQISESAERFAGDAPDSHFSRDFEVEDSQMQADSGFADPDTSEDGILNSRYLVVLGHSNEEKRGKRTPLVERADPKRIALFKKTYKEYLASSDKQDQPWDSYTKVRGRMLGDLLFSESTFDRLTKEALRNAKWLLDSDLAPWKVFEKLEEIAKSVLSRRSSEAFVPQRGDSEPHDLSSFSMFRRRGAERASDDSKPELPDFPEFKCPEGKKGTKSFDMKEEPSEETIVSAITNKGVQVKLRLGPELGNPYLYLHRILSVAEVSLNIEMTPKCAVESKNPESESERITPSLFVDLSDKNQLNSLLKTLRKFQALN